MSGSSGLSGLLGRLRGRREPAAEPVPLREIKLRAIDHAFGKLGCRSLADLGGVWMVDGGYALHAIDSHGAERAVICDDEFSEPLLARARDDERVELVAGNFGRPETVGQIGQVDAIALFDILLHQVRPDWDEMLEMYARVPRCFVISQPMWNGDSTVRLLELGRERYVESVILPEWHDQAWDRLDEWHPERGRLWRDSHDIWQWGNTETDLVATMARLGFELDYRENLGPWMGLERFDDVAMVFRS